MIRRRATALAAVAAAMVALTGCVSPGSGATGEPSDVRHASPAGQGDCSAAAPCTLARALTTTPAGGVIELAAGDYGDLTLRDGGGSPDSPLTVRAAPDAVARFGELRSSTPVVWQGVRVEGAWFLDDGADGSRIEKAEVDGGGIFVRADHVEVRDSLIHNGSSLDGIQIGGASDVLIAGNTIRDFDQDLDNGRHADCIQLFDVDTVEIRGNRISSCYNAGIIISGGGRGIVDVTIEANFVQGCVAVTAECGGGSAAELRDPGARGLVVRNNTFLDGSVRWGSVSGNVFDRNIVGYLSECGSVVTNTIVASWNRKMCKQPDWLGADGNREGEVEVVDRAGGDLHPIDGAQVRIDPAGDGGPAAEGIDGATLPKDIAGAVAP